jgi:hypothetical protein
MGVQFHHLATMPFVVFASITMKEALLSKHFG